MRNWISFLGIVSLGVVLYFGNLLSAQDNNESTNKDTIVLRTYNIRKIYSHRLGYRIDVMDYRSRVRSIYAKLAWFYDAELKNPNSEQFEVTGEMLFLPPTRYNPSNYLTLKYQGGKLISIYIYIDEPKYTASNYHNIWWSIDPRENIDSKFDITTIEFTDPPAIPAGAVPE